MGCIRAEQSSHASNLNTVISIGQVCWARSFLHHYVSQVSKEPLLITLLCFFSCCSYQLCLAVWAPLSCPWWLAPMPRLLWPSPESRYMDTCLDLSQATSAIKLFFPRVFNYSNVDQFLSFSFSPSLPLPLPLLFPLSLCRSLIIQLIFNAGVSFPVIMWVWSGVAGMAFLNCFLNWPSESFITPEEMQKWDGPSCP